MRAFAENFGFDPNGYTARDELNFSDPIWAHWYDRRLTPGLDDAFISTMMDMRRDYFLHSRCGEDWMYKTYSTGVFATLLDQFNMAIQDHEEGKTDDLHRRRFFFYSDHDTGVQNFACALSYIFEIYIPYDSQYLWELHVVGSEYHV